MFQEKSEMLKAVKKHILANPKSTFGEVQAAIKSPSLTTIQFYNVRAQLRRKGSLMDSGKSHASADDAGGKKSSVRSGSNHIEILQTMDASTFSPAILEHYKTTVLPLLQRLHPDGKNLQFVFLSDPPALEIRKRVP